MQPTRLTISHRGNLNGPRSCDENSPHSIDAAIALQFDVEIDLRVNDDEELWLGHDQPEHRVSEGWLRLRSDRLWIHAKNEDALHWCLKRGHRCFAHDRDDVVLTSTREAWRYPKRTLKVRSTTIIVLPEQCDATREQLERCKGVCTDYAWAFSLAGPWCLPQSRVYEEMMSRPAEFSFDPRLAERRPDDRRCVAAYSFLKPLRSEALERLTAVLREHFPDHCHYAGDAGLAGGVLHSTLLQLVSFSAFAPCDVTPYKTCVEPLLPAEGYTIAFRHLILVKTGLLLAGYASIDLGPIRDQIRRSVVASGLLLAEPYFNNICHTTLMRFTKPLTEDSESRLLLAVLKEYSNCNFGDAETAPPVVGLASWRMRPEELSA